MKNLDQLEYIVVVQLETRSFDHGFGGLAREISTLDVDLGFTNHNHDLETLPRKDLARAQALRDNLAGV